MTDPPTLTLLDRAWVQTLAIAVLALLAFEPAMTGGLVWDDALVIGPASGLPGPLASFSTDLFAAGGGPGASYYRPLVTLSYWIDTHTFTAAPHVGLHLTNLLWHVAASVLVLRTLRRWTAPDTGLANAGCLAAAAAWAILAHKAENVAWISGRGDVMGLVFALAGMEIAARVQRPPVRAAVAVAASMLALLCKESLVAVVPLALADALARARQQDPTGTRRPWAHLQVAARSPYVLGAGAAAAAYLVARATVLPISSGGDGMLTPVVRIDKALLFLETTGVAATTLLTPWRGELLRSPIGFRDPQHLVHLPVMAAVGAAAWAALVAAFARFPDARPSIATGAGAFLPVSNLVPMALEARVADRFLYTPSLGLAAGLALVIARLAPRHARWVALAALAAIAPLLLTARARAALFASDDALFQWEARRRDPAVTVLTNAAVAATAADRHRDARDLRLREMERYHQLGFSGEGFPQLYEAIRSQTLATEESHPASLQAFERLSRALLRGERGTLVVPFDDDRSVTVDAGHQAARDFVARRRHQVAVNLAFVLARRGDAEEAVAIASDAVDSCPTCQQVVGTAVQTAQALGRVDLATKWLARLRWWGPRQESLVAVNEAQRALVDAGGLGSPALSLFAGGAWRPACAAFDAVPSRGPAVTRARVTACVLGNDLDRVAGLGGVDTRASAEAESLRWDGVARARLVMAAASED